MVMLPHHLLSRVMLFITRIQWKPFKNTFIASFSRLYNIELAQAVCEHRDDFACFNDFFTRELKPELRPLESSDTSIICPADGAISQFGAIRAGELIQAKGKHFTLNQLLGLGEPGYQQFNDGQFATIYLSPADCHRVFMPIDGVLTRMVHIPGRLFSVNQHSSESVDRLFARNERVVMCFQTAIGTMAFIMVGAIFVSSIETVWSGVVTPPTAKRIRSWDYPETGDGSVALKKGEELGRFNMGSTVILLFESANMAWASELANGDTVRYNQAIGHQTDGSR